MALSIDDLKNNVEVTEQVIEDPNLARLKAMRQEQSELHAVTPEQLGFKPKPDDPNKYKDNVDLLLEKFEQEIIPQKMKEMETFNELVEQTDGTLTEKELREELGQDAANVIDGGKGHDKVIPERIAKEMESVGEGNTPRTTSVDSFNVYANNYTDDEDPELDDEDINYMPTSNNTESVKDEVEEDHSVGMSKEDFSDVESNSNVIPFNNDTDDEEDEDNEEEDEVEDEQFEALKKLVKSKLAPVAKKFDLSSFQITNKPVALSSALNTVESPATHAADWGLYSSKRHIRMRGFTGSELTKLSQSNNALEREQAVMYNASAIYNMIFDHIIDSEKPKTMEQWAKCTSFFDIDHVWFCAYRACFNNANYLPFNCTNDDCKHVFLTDDIDTIEMVKFKDEKIKKEFLSIINSKEVVNSKLYTSELVQISDNFAFSFREPSIYNMVFETAMLDADFRKKYEDILNILVYIDNIYYINASTMQLNPVPYKIWNNNITRTTKARINQYAKVLRSLSSDQFNSLFGYIDKINKMNNEDVTYQIPEVTCPKCGTTLPAQRIGASNLVFTRHQLTTLALL